MFLIGGGSSQGGIESQVGDLIFLWQAGLDVTAAFTVGLGARAAASLVAGQAIQLGIEAAGGELLSR
jgi:hypothetical protein